MEPSAGRLVSNLIADPERLQALFDFAVLDTSPEQGFDDIVELAAALCETPVALVSLVSGDRQWFKARVGFDPSQTDLNSSVCALGLASADVVVIPNLMSDPRTAGNPLVTGEPHIRFYAGAPLRTADGHPLGSLCVIDSKPRPEGLTAHQIDHLQRLARQVMSQLNLRRAIKELDDARVRQNELERLRRDAETQYRLLFEGTETAFCIVEMKFDGDTPVDYRFIEVNPAFAKTTGLVNAQGRWMRDLAPAHEQHWFDIYGTVAKTGRPVRFENAAKELEDRWYEVQAFRVGEPDAYRVGILFNDITDRRRAEIYREQAEASQNLLNSELSHRMKNTFAMVQAVASQTLRAIPDQEPVEAFIERLHALSKAHDVLLDHNWAAADLDEIVRKVVATLAPLERFEIEGPQVQLGARTTMSLSLLLHELTTNALKYGALSTDAGRIAIGWHLRVTTDEPELVLTWRETGGPPAEPPKHHGFGSRLIRLGLVGTGGVDLRYGQSGLTASFVAPLSQIQLS